jgi:hypothetical protein
MTSIIRDHMSSGIDGTARFLLGSSIIWCRVVLASKRWFDRGARCLWGAACVISATRALAPPLSIPRLMIPRCGEGAHSHARGGLYAAMVSLGCCCSSFSLFELSHHCTHNYDMIHSMGQHAAGDIIMTPWTLNNCTTLVRVRSKPNSIEWMYL